MNSDLTRDEAIDWCVAKKVDFTRPIFPPPEGWMWFDTGAPAKGLTAVFTADIGDDDEDITSIDVFLRVAAEQRKLRLN